MNYLMSVCGHVIAKFSRMGSLALFLTHGAPLKSLIIIQIQEARWRKWNNKKPFFGRNEELYISKEVKENALTWEGKSYADHTQ